MRDYLFVIVTTHGAYVHGEVDTMSEDEMEAAVERVYDIITEPAVMHVRPMPSGSVEVSRLEGARWEAHRFNPSCVVSVFATEA